MLAEYLGEKDFRNGLRYYLKKYSYKNTETTHLWQSFEKVSGKPVSKMMHNWTSKPGYPVVRASVVKGKINFSQTRFFASPLSAKKIKDKTKWEIPITFKQNKVNFGETGFFRTAYSKELLEKLRKPIRERKLSARDRLGVIRDLFALSEAGIISTTDALEFLSTYKNEDNYTVWVEIATGLAQLDQLLAMTTSEPALMKLTSNMFSPLAYKMGWNKKDKDTHTDALLRSLAISRAGSAGDKKIIKEAQSKFSQIIKNKYVSPDIRGAIYSLIAKNGSAQEYKILTERYIAESLHEEKNRLGYALSDFTDPKILNMACEFAISKHVRIQDSVGILSGIAGNPHGRDVWFSFINKNWKLLTSRYDGGGFTLARLVKGISSSAEEKHFKSFKKFFSNHEAPGAKRAIEQVLERLESNIAWLKRDGKIIGEFLEKI